MTHQGVIKTFGNNKGFGFIASDTVEGDAFFGRKDLPAFLQDGEDGLALVGKTVAFELKQDPKTGKPQAYSIQYLPREGERCEGKVTDYNPVRGFGFISSTFEKDVYFQTRDIPASFQGQNIKGLSVSFTPKVTNDGMVQSGKLFMQPGSGMAGVMGGMAGMMGMPVPSSKHASDHEEGSWLHGTVKTVNLEKGFAFLGCEGLPDVFFKLDRAKIAVEVGQPVCFSLRWTKDRKPQAAEVLQTYAEGELALGVVQSYSEKNGYGFVSVAEQPMDAYFKRKDMDERLAAMGQAMLGMTVQFQVHLLPSGKMQARGARWEDQVPKQEVQAGARKRPASSPAPFANGAPTKRPRVNQANKGAFAGKGVLAGKGAMGGLRVSGTVLSYNGLKGWGFISSPQVPGDVFFKKAWLPASDQHLQQNEVVGRNVTFVLNFGSQGSPQGESISFH